MCQAKAAQVPPDRAAVGLNPMLRTQFDHQFIKGQVALFPDPAPDPVRNASQLAMPTPVARLLGLQRSRRTLQKHRVIHELDRNPEPRCRSPVRVTFLNKINNPPTKLHRKWLVPQ